MVILYTKLYLINDYNINHQADVTNDWTENEGPWDFIKIIHNIYNFRFPLICIIVLY